MKTCGVFTKWRAKEKIKLSVPLLWRQQNSNSVIFWSWFIITIIIITEWACFINQCLTINSRPLMTKTDILCPNFFQHWTFLTRKWNFHFIFLQYTSCLLTSPISYWDLQSVCLIFCLISIPDISNQPALNCLTVTDILFFIGLLHYFLTSETLESDALSTCGVTWRQVVALCGIKWANTFNTSYLDINTFCFCMNIPADIYSTVHFIL